MRLQTTTAKIAKPKTSNTARLRAQLDESFYHVLAHQTPVTRDMGMVFVFTLPLSPISMNSRGHWRVREAIKKDYEAYFDGLRLREMLPPVPRCPWPRAIATATFYTKGHNDLDNLMGRGKFAQDCIVKGRWVADDGPECWQWGEVPKQVVDPKKPASLVLRLRLPVGDEWDALWGETP